MTVSIGTPDCATPNTVSYRAFRNLIYDNPWQANVGNGTPASNNVKVAVGARCCPTTPNGLGYLCTAITTGITGGTEPTWPLVLSNTVVDGGVTWTAEDVANPSGKNTCPLQQFGYAQSNTELNAFRVLAWDTSKGIVDSANTEKWDATTQVSGSNSGPGRYPITNELIVWGLDDTSGASPYFVNAGSAGSAGNLDTIYATSNVYYGVRGLVTDGGVFFDNSGNGGATIAFDASGSSAIESTTGIAIVGWYWPFTSSQVSNLNIFGKSYRPHGTWNAPYVSIGLSIFDNSGGDSLSFNGNVSISGSLHQLTSISGLNSVGRFTVGQWNLLLVQYDPTTGKLQLGLNGYFIPNPLTLGANPIDWGTHGPWSGLGPGSNPSSLSASYFNDWRVFPNILTASTFRSMYRTPLGLIP